MHSTPASIKTIVALTMAIVIFGFGCGSLRAQTKTPAAYWVTETLEVMDQAAFVNAIKAVPPIVQESDNSSTDNDSTSPRDVRSFMLNTRYWWLEGAPTDRIRRGIGNVFDKYDIECIAPGYGCILRGRNVVARHYAMLDEFLKACDKSVAVSRYVTRDEER